MPTQFTLQYWIEDDWYIGRLKEVPGVFSQGETLEELENNIREVYFLMGQEDELPEFHGRTKEVLIKV